MRDRIPKRDSNHAKLNRWLARLDLSYLNEAMASQKTSGQASDIIAGFRYQILQSIMALVDLERDGELLLEVSEDFSVVADGVQTDVQVKGSQAGRGPPSYSLRTQSIRNVLVRFWDAVKASPDTQRKLAFMARGYEAVERGFSLPDGASGIAYWRAAAIDADTAPLRAMLIDFLAGSDLGDWLASSPSDAELRDRLLRRVSWQLEELPADALYKEALDRLRRLYFDMNLPVAAADHAMSGLIDLVFERASRPVEAHRRLSRIDLEYELQKVVGPLLVIERMQRQPVAMEDLLISEVSRPEVVATRPSTVENLVAGAQGQPLIWLCGSHGTGKSTLARLAASSIGGKWLVLDAWPIKGDSVAALAVWRTLTNRIATEDLSGVILDNLVDVAGETIAERLGPVVRSFGARGGRVIAISHRQPSPAELMLIGSNSPPVQAPYFSQSEIAELISAGPSPPSDDINAWALMIGVGTSGGHPTLVAAKVASLRTRAWPKSALIEDLTEVSEAKSLTQETARRKLLRSLDEMDAARSSNAAQLLRRIASVFDRVDEPLALKLAAQNPPVKNAGDALAALKGSWLEVLPFGDLRVSPLISDISADVAEDTRSRWKQVAAIYWISRKTLDERTLPLSFWNAFLGQQEWVLIKISQTMQMMDADKFVAAAPMLSPLIVLATDKALYSGQSIASAFVRVLQFRVAAALDNQDVARKAANRLLVELQELDELPRVLMTTTGALQVLLSDADVDTSVRLEFALRLRNDYPIAERLTENQLENPRRLLPPQLREDMDTSDFLITRVVGMINSTERFQEVVGAFENLRVEDRNRFLDAIGIMYGGLSVFASNGWAGDQMAGREMEATLRAYEQVEDQTTAWQRPDLQIELAISRSVILDESLSMQEDALQVIENAISTHGDNPQLLRQQARVFGHMGRHSEAADLTLTIEDSVGLGDSLERTLALRDGAVSAAKDGRFDQAERLFEKARQNLSDTADHRPLRVALLIERSLSLWRAGNRLEAVALAADVLDQLEDIDSSSSRQAERTHQYGRAIIGMFYGEPERMPVPDTSPFDLGWASQLERSDGELQNFQLAPLPDNWRILAAVAADLGAFEQFHQRSTAKQGGTLSTMLERAVLANRYATAVAAGDVPTTLSVIALIRRVAELVGSPDYAERAPLHLFEVDISAFNREENREYVNLALLDLLSYRVVKGTYDQSFVRRIAEGLDGVFGDAKLGSQVLDAASQLYAVDPSSRYAFLAQGVSQHIGRVTQSPSVRLHRDVTLFSHVPYSVIRGELIPGASDLIIKGWRQVADEADQSLKNALGDAFALSASPVATAKAVLAAASKQVQHNFAMEWFEFDWPE